MPDAYAVSRSSRIVLPSQPFLVGVEYYEGFYPRLCMPLAQTRSWDGKLYKEGEESTPPAPRPVDAPTVVIASDNITIADADFLLAASKAGEKTAEWLIAKLDL